MTTAPNGLVAAPVATTILTTTGSLDDLYREVGTALHTAQLAEFNLVSIHLLLIRTGTVEKPKERLDSYWTKKTLGQLLEPILASELLPDDATRFLETLRNARNHLTHLFFMSASSVHTPEGVANLLREITAMHRVFSRAVRFFDHMLSELARPAGIDVEEIKAFAQVTLTTEERDLD